MRLPPRLHRLLGRSTPAPPVPPMCGPGDPISFADLSEIPDTRLLPPLDRPGVPAIEAELAACGAEIRQFTAEKGDVLIWHGRLMHRGSPPRSHDLLRRALIAHYSGAHHRPDLTARVKDANGMVYFAAGLPLWQQEEARVLF